jgi:hypothetical protein
LTLCGNDIQLSASPFEDSITKPNTHQHQHLDPSGLQTKESVQYHRVGCGEVDAQPTRTRAQKEESWCIWPVAALLEAIHLRTAFQRTRGTIYAA